MWQFVRWINDQELEHLKPFTEVERLDDLLRQSLIGQLDAALDNARIDADLRARRELDASFSEAISY